MIAKVAYVRSRGASVAYHDYGGDGPTLLQLNNGAALMDLGGAPPRVSRNLERLARFVRLVCIDKRGVGRSDRMNLPLMDDAHVEDIEAVRAALGVERFALLAHGGGVAIALAYAAAYAENVSHLIVMSGMCCDAGNPEEFGAPEREEHWDRVLRTSRSHYSSFIEGLARQILPDGSAADQEDVRQHLERASTPADWEALWEGTIGMDQRLALSAIRAPTLVLHAVDDGIVQISHSRYIAEQVPDARLVELMSSAHQPLFDPAVAGQVLAEIEEHLTSTSIRSRERAIVAVLFTDIVQSTRHQRSSGDVSWRDFRERFERRAEHIVAEYRGHVVQFLGDGVLAEFPSGSDALDAARDLVADAQRQGVEIRAGVHAGEVYRVEDQLFGTCVTIAARVMAVAEPSEVLTTEVVSGLVEGTGIELEEPRLTELKGFGRRRVVSLRQ